jgi:Flp pilus assembly secretin CpaC
VFALFIVAAIAAPLRSAHAADEPLAIMLDQATILKLPEKVATIVVGNPLIADVAVQSGGVAIVTGKGFGTTNLIAMDRTGAVLMEKSVLVRGPGDQIVQVYRGVERETYSCAPKCERRITLGDSLPFFSSTIGQADMRSGQATAAGARAQNR